MSRRTMLDCGAASMDTRQSGESGKWFTQSPVKDAGNLISNVGSAYVILALQACGELPGWPFSPTKPAGR